MNFDTPSFAKERQEMTQLKICENGESAREWRIALYKSNHHHQDLNREPKNQTVFSLSFDLIL